MQNTKHRPHPTPDVRPDAGGETIGVHLESDLILALDRYAKEHGDLTRPEALRAVFRDWAIARGYAPSADEGTRPEDLNASNDD